MKQQVTKRSECSEVGEQQSSKGSLVQKAKAGAVKGAKVLLSSLLLKPATWRWLMVNLPELSEKAENVGKQVIAWFTDSF